MVGELSYQMIEATINNHLSDLPEGRELTEVGVSLTLVQICSKGSALTIQDVDILEAL